MATVHVCGFECGLTPTNSTSAHHFNNNGTTATDTGTVRPGGSAMSVKVTCNGSAASAEGAFFTSILAAGNARVLSFYLYLQTSLPAANAELFRLNKGTAGRDVAIGFEQSSSKLCIYSQTNFAGRVLGPVIAHSTWYRIDLYVNGTGGTADWKVNGAAQTQLAIGGTTGTYSWCLFGHNTSADVGFTAYTAFYDDAAISATGADFPLADGPVVRYVPNADGTHNTGGGSNFTNAAGTAITDATTNANTYLDEVPPTTTDRVEQRLDTSGNRYVEVRFDSTGASAAPLGVSFTTARRTASAANANGAIKMRDGAGSTDDTIVSGVVNSTTDLYAVKHYAARPAALGAWTQAALQDLRARFGFGTDVTPDIWFGGIVAEASFSASETHSASVTATGGGVLTPSSVTRRTRTQAVTGGGITTVSQATTRTRTQAATGGGIATASAATLRAASVTATGGGVATPSVAKVGRASAVATGAGVATTSATTTRTRSDVATGAGVTTVAQSTVHTSAHVATGGGVVSVAQSTARATSVEATGAGVVTIAGSKRAALALAATGAGVADADATTIREASVAATGGGSATVDGEPVSDDLRSASIVVTGGGVAAVMGSKLAFVSLGATGGGTIPIDAETWRLASVIVTGGGIATVDGGKPPFDWAHATSAVTLSAMAAGRMTVTDAVPSTVTLSSPAAATVTADRPDAATVSISSSGSGVVTT